MIWIVSEAVSGSTKELKKRHEYIQEVTKVNVSPWIKRTLSTGKFMWRTVNIYQCASRKAHIEEVPIILKETITSKRAIVVVNSCIMKKSVGRDCLSFVKKQNGSSRLFFAKQEMSHSGALVNFTDNVGTFGFSTTLSERELYIHRNDNIIKAITLSYNEVFSNEL